MLTSVSMPEIKEYKEFKKERKDDFLEEFANSYLQAQVDDKKEQLSEYRDALKNTEDKNSFNAEYLETLIEVLKMEIAELEK